MRRAVVITTAVVAALGLAGCSSSKPTARATAHAASPIASSSSPSGATVTQWASFIAGHETMLLKADEEMDGCRYAVDPRPCLLPGLGFTFGTEALSQQIKNAEAGQLGEPPAEIADLVQSTIEALDAVKAADDAREKCGANADMACLQLDAAWDSAHDDAIAALNAWKPYIG